METQYLTLKMTELSTAGANIVVERIDKGDAAGVVSMPRSQKAWHHFTVSPTRLQGIELGTTVYSYLRLRVHISREISGGPASVP
jgi:hypothetical protein